MLISDSRCLSPKPGLHTFCLHYFAKVLSPEKSTYYKVKKLGNLKR